MVARSISLGEVTGKVYRIRGEALDRGAYPFLEGGRITGSGAGRAGGPIERGINLDSTFRGKLSGFEDGAVRKWVGNRTRNEESKFGSCRPIALPVDVGQGN